MCAKRNNKINFFSKKKFVEEPQHLCYICYFSHAFVSNLCSPLIVNLADFPCPLISFFLFWSPVAFVRRRREWIKCTFWQVRGERRGGGLLTSGRRENVSCHAYLLLFPRSAVQKHKKGGRRVLIYGWWIVDLWGKEGGQKRGVFWNVFVGFFCWSGKKHVFPSPHKGKATIIFLFRDRKDVCRNILTFFAVDPIERPSWLCFFFLSLTFFVEIR